MIFKIKSFFEHASNNTKFIDDTDRVWVKQVQYGQAFLVGLTKDTPSFTAQQLTGLAIEGFRVLPSEQTETTEDAQEKHKNKRSFPSRVVQHLRH